MFRTFASGIRGKLLLLALLPLAVSIVNTFLTFNRADKMSSAISDLTQNVIPTMQSMGEIRKARNASRQWFWSGIVHAENTEQRQAAVDKSIAEFKLLESAFLDYEKTPQNDFEEKEYPQIKALLPEYKDVFYKIATHIKSGTPADLKAATELLDHRYLELGLQISAYCEKVHLFYDKLAQEESTHTVAAHSELKSTNIWSSAISSILLFAITFLISENIVRKISAVSEDLQKAGQHVRESIEQLSSAGLALSQSSTSSAASLEETVASLEEMSSMVTLNSDNARQAAKLSQTSYQAAEKGEKEIQKLITSMQEISHSSKKIEEIINVIDDIAFQTNLLALNAAVEAARAGEQGKGFAVVAEAVRGLAARSASAAKDISTLIKDSVTKIDIGTSIADQSGAVLTEIVTSVRKVSDINNEIAEASTQQATGLTQINRAMNDLDQSSQNNAASAEQIASTSTEIQGQATHVEQEVAFLNTIVLGNRKTSYQSAA